MQQGFLVSISIGASHASSSLLQSLQLRALDMDAAVQSNVAQRAVLKATRALGHNVVHTLSGLLGHQKQCDPKFMKRQGATSESKMGIPSARACQQ